IDAGSGRGLLWRTGAGSWVRVAARIVRESRRDHHSRPLRAEPPYALFQDDDLGRIADPAARLFVAEEIDAGRQRGDIQREVVLARGEAAEAAGPEAAPRDRVEADR